MSYILPLILGFIIATIGVIPPGLINMTVAKLSLIEGKTRALVFASGATLVVFFQTYIALLFSKIINRRSDIVMLLQEVGLAIFILLTIYFLLIAQKSKVKKAGIKTRSKRRRFLLGMLFSLLNLFPVPYYVFISITLSAYNFFYFDTTFILLFVIGVVIGTFLTFVLYILFFNKYQKQTLFFINNVNYIIGSITGLISFFTLIKIVNRYLK